MTLVEKKKYPEISWRKKSNLFNEIHTNIINNDIAEKSFIYKATEDNHLGFSDINGGMTTENRNKNYQQSVDHMNKLLKFYIILMQRKGGGGFACVVEEQCHRSRRKKLEPNNAFWFNFLFSDEEECNLY